MCGIIAILGQPDLRPVPDSAPLLAGLEAALRALDGGDLVVALEDAAAKANDVDLALRGGLGVRVLLANRDLRPALLEAIAAVEGRLADIESSLDSGRSLLAGRNLERANRALVALRDATWAIAKDRVRTALAVSAFAGPNATPASIDAYLAVQLALSAIDRLEVRGRDSAGLHLLVTDHELDLTSASIRALIDGRHRDPLFGSGSVRVSDGVLGFVYKAAAEIGELGDNTAALRAAISADPLLRLALAGPAVRCAVLGHTRWASVGIISEANTHPLNSEELDGSPGPYVLGALNGDVDNHADLMATDGLRVAAEITTDAKVIPTLVARAAATAPDFTEAFRRTVSRFDGSVAIAAASASAPHQLSLALRGSGQALYIGMADGMFVVASEPYGLIEVTDQYLRMDGDTPARSDQPSSRGQIVVLDGDRAGSLGGVRRLAYDGSELAVVESELAHAEITTRDIDRGAHPHFLLKEISEAPDSFRKTLRGKVVAGDDGLLRAVLGEETLPDDVLTRLGNGSIERVVVLGQGTAAVAGQAMVALFSELAAGSRLRIEATTATEFSGFALTSDLSDTLVVAVSQSGTTTDTNRTVDLARDRGACVIAIVNRRSSDLCDKADGVLFTSDGRDVEMSVASTKAFYAQVAAGAVLACALSDQLGVGDDRRRHQLLDGLRSLPEAMRAVLATRSDIAVAAQRFAPFKRYWAVVGNGPNKVAAEEVRIKLSELCYKSIACDVTEDKKHIDLSSEPMILVCAAGLVGSNADDVAKEVAIYRAHKATPIVIATEGEERFAAALQLITVPRVEPALAFVLSSMAGHLFGYEAALAIDAQARQLREARAAIEEAAGGLPTGEVLLARLGAPLTLASHRFFDHLRAGAYNGHLEASTAVQLASLFRYANGIASLEAYQTEHGKMGTPQVVVEDLTSALTRAIEELTRPIDAIKHQAKTVTVGISRSDEGLLGNRLVQELLAAGSPRDRLAYRTLKTLADLEPAIASVLGSVRYQIEGDPRSGEATIEIVDRTGIGIELRSRTEGNPQLLGTKRLVAEEREVYATKGRSDGRQILLVPEAKGTTTTGITLLHVRFADRLTPAVARHVLQGYRNRWSGLTDLVTETEPVFRDDLLANISVEDLLTLPLLLLADRWRA
ncbi:MAG: glucosamine 6-phosphate synthetase, contains amidotransferase and phosphosugar isomerase domain [Acidimicrobiia bacterium]|nr:glucosamine 6-phosphate synthetase, contains amidotransferase and phosphosugar isomerase domain [Acidimicrobiia bacterium]